MKVFIAAALLTGLLACAVTEGIVQRGESPAGDVLPGAEPFAATLNDSLRSAWVIRPADYVPRTQHLRDARTPLFVNRLFLESSPYLRQHAHNPVNWFPWGNEAFELAVSLGRPIFLSIGYSTCHWCHVMEEESFDDIEIARYLNEHYVAIKVDRELRPDLDSIYMSAVQLFTRGNGGWPMTLWLTPQGQPYSGGSYFPARDGDRGVSAGLLTLLKQLKEAYDDQPDRVVAVAAQVVDEIRTRLNPGLSGTEVLDDSSIQKAASNYLAEFDSTFGGIRGTQKFPASLPLRFLLRYHRRTGDLDFLNMVTTTLERITAGGIHDHVGGGFHRYATDERWLVPHFEKMLYDNALLTLAYLEAYQATGREDFADVVHSTLRYVEREMSAPNGGFYSATDADSLSPRGTREEGWFFTWTPEEIEGAVGPERAHIITAYFGVTASGHLGERSVLHRASGDLELARKLGISLDHLRITVNEAREMLYEVRRQRPAPLRDEKIVTAWNGLMISAFARASHVLSTGDYAARARRAATFLIEQTKVDDRLVRSPTVGAVNGFGYLDDYAFMVSGLLDLFEVTGEIRWFREALLLDMVLERDFEDQVEGGFFRAPIDADLLLTREKPHYDSAEPSGNAVHLLNLIRLHDFTGDDRYRRRAESAFTVFQPTLTHLPTAASEMLLALDYSLDTPKAVIIVVPTSRSEAEPFLTRLSSIFLPNKILVVAVEGSDLEEQASLVPILVGKYAMRGMATAYVCENRVCDLPTTDPEVFSHQIQDNK